MAGGAKAREALQGLLAQDPDRQRRQVLMVDARGRTAAWTGTSTLPSSGHLTGEDYALVGFDAAF